MGTRQAGSIDRRGWMGLTAGLVLGVTPARSTRGMEPVDSSALAEEQAEFKTAEEKLRQVGIDTVRSVRSQHFQALGDAPLGFMKLVLEDAELLALDFLEHFRAREFDVHPPNRHLTLVVFNDDRSFGKFFGLPTMLQASERGQAQPVGVYVRATNMLHIFDWRKVPVLPRSSRQNITTLAHEGTHLLCFNSGLLDRAGDCPLCFVEGLAMYAEARKVSGRSELGLISLKRVDDLAKIQRRKPWIPVQDLIADDTVMRARDADRLMLGYAESWLMVHYLMKQPARLPGFRAYLKAIAGPVAAGQRLTNAKTHLGDLLELDRELRRYSVKVVRSA